MMLPNPNDALHKAMLYRLLIAIVDNKELASCLYFKGGTCAAMLGWLDRFSVDLDFDLATDGNKQKVRQLLLEVFSQTGFTVAQSAKTELFFILQYNAQPGQRNNLKVSIIDNPVRANVYEPQYLNEIDRYVMCQSKETMVANKLVAVTDRFKKHHTIAGRDIYDVHHFFIRGYHFNDRVITERTGKTPAVYIKELAGFIEKRVTQKMITEDLSFLLPTDRFQAIRKTLKSEVLLFLKK